MTGSIGGLDLRSTTTGRVSNPPLPSHSFVTLQYYGVEPLGSVVKDGLLISYGPPILEPDLLLLSFQGGGTDQVVQKNWPKKLLHLNSPERFGKKLRELCCATGLYTSLETSTMAFPTVFPQGPSKEADCWEKGSGLYSVWCHHSVDWVERLVKDDQSQSSHRFRGQGFKSIRHSLGEDRAFSFSKASNIWRVDVSWRSCGVLSSSVSELPQARSLEVL